MIDETEPELLNLAVEVLEDGRARVTWYTSESSTEEVYLNDILVYSDNFATKKNHDYVTEVLNNGEWGLIVKSADASGNSNSSSFQFTVGIEGEQNQNIQQNDEEEEESDTDEVSTSFASATIIQIGILIIITLLLLAFIRVRKNESNEDDKWA